MAAARETPIIRAVLAALAAGAGAGALVLGIGGRMLMTLLVLLVGGRPGFSIGGSFTVVSVGIGYGAVGGVLLVLLLGIRPAWRLPAGSVLGVLLFIIAWMTSTVGRSAATGRVGLAVGLGVLAFALWGVVAAVLFTRWTRLARG